MTSVKSFGMQGITSISVSTLITKIDMPTGMLTEGRINTDVQLKLRREGLPVDDSTLDRNSELIVSIIILESHLKSGKSRGNYSYSVRVGLNLIAVIPTNWQDWLNGTMSGFQFVLAQTWGDMEIGTASSSAAEQAIREVVSDLTDNFLN